MYIAVIDLSTRPKRPLERAGSWAQDEWPLLTQHLGEIGMLFAAILLGNRDPSGVSDWAFTFPGIALWVSTVLTISGAIFRRREGGRVGDLEAKVDTLTSDLNAAQEENFTLLGGYSALIDEQLQRISSDVLKFNDTERVSLYKHDTGQFRRIGRYSRSPVYHQPGRAAYHQDQGCVGEAWKNGKGYELNLPDPIKEKGAYLEILEERWGIPLNVAEGLKMKSRSIAAFPLENNGHRFAVIVFESTRTDVLELSALEDIVTGPEGRWLCSVALRARPILTSPSMAEREGY